MIIKKFPALSFPRSNKGRAPQRGTRLRAKNMLIGLTLFKITAHTNTKAGLFPNLALLVQHQIKNKRERNGQENAEVIYCYYNALEKPGRKNANDSYTKWCSQNKISDKFDKLNAYKLANQKRYFIRYKKLTDIELIQIKEQVMNDIDTENKNKDVKKKAVAKADLIETKPDMKVKDCEKICDVENEMKEKIKLGNIKFNGGKI